MNTTLKRCGLVLALLAACASLPAAAERGGGYGHGGYEGRGGWGGYGGGWGWGWGGIGLGLGLGAAYLANPYVYAPYYDYPYAYPYGYAPPAVVIDNSGAPVSPQGTTMAPPAPGQQASGSWFYCDSAKGYYPYVAQCPEPWRRVSATPPGAVQ